jgi:hypothetical protein
MASYIFDEVAGAARLCAWDACVNPGDCSVILRAQALQTSVVLVGGDPKGDSSSSNLS